MYIIKSEDISKPLLEKVAHQKPCKDMSQLKMTSHVLCKMTNLYFEDVDQWVLNLKLLLSSAGIASRQWGRPGQGSQPQACYAHTGVDTCPAPLTLLALKEMLSEAGGNFKSGKVVGYLQSADSHLIKYLVGHLKVGHVKSHIKTSILVLLLRLRHLDIFYNMHRFQPSNTYKINFSFYNHTKNSSVS